MRILFLYNRIPFPLNDGGNLAVHHVAIGLKKLGHEVDIAFLNTLKHYQSPDAIKAIYNKVYSVDIDTSLEPFALFKSLFESKPYNVQRFYSKQFEELLRDIVQKNTYDIIQIEGAYMGLYVPLLRRLVNVPIVLRSHNVEHQIWERVSRAEENPFKRWYLTMLSPKIKSFEAFSAQLYHQIISITDQDAHYYHKTAPQVPVTTISAGMVIDPNVLLYQPSDSPAVCFIGSMEWIPNIQGLEWFLERVWPMVLQFEPKAKCHLAGKGMFDIESKWKHIQGVVLHGQVPDAKEFIQNHGIFIVPLLSGGGMRLKMVEGMSLGRPIVATTIGAEGVDYHRNVDVAIADQPEAFANAILDLWHHPEKATQLAHNAYSKAKNQYDWDSLVKRFESVYESLL
ncbi:MAG: glycosyltransferase family 4 protein [Cytophagaceae bacterium]